MTDRSAYPVFDRAGKYRLGPKLGAGGMAEVHRGWIVGQSGVERLVAIKRILPGQFDTNPQMRELFANEARLASRLHHANIVQMIDFDQDPEGRLFQVMEFVDGCDLERLASTVPFAGTLPISISCYVIAQVLRALDYAYNGEHPETGGQLGIVHRDATPSNVMLSWAGDVKLTDLGVAKAVLATQATISGSLTGKPSYMSPEQVNGERLDGRSDVFAAGVMLWELLTGRRLFVGDSVPGVLAQVIQYSHYARRLDPPHEINRSVPPSLSTIVAGMLAVERDQRPGDAGAAYALLRECADVRMADAPELSDLLAARFPDRAPHRAVRRPSSASAAGPGPATREQMCAPTRSLPADVTPMAGQVQGVRTPRGAKVGLAIAGALLGAVAITTAVLVASDDSSTVPAAMPARQTPRERGAPVPAAPAAVVQPEAPPTVPTSEHAGDIVEVPPSAVDATPAAPAVAAQPDAGPVEKKPRRSRRPSRSQMQEVDLGSK